MASELHIINKPKADILATIQSADELMQIDNHLQKQGIFMQDILTMLGNESHNLDNIFSVCYKYILPYLAPSAILHEFGYAIKLHTITMSLYNIRYIRQRNTLINALQFLTDENMEYHKSFT